MALKERVIGHERLQRDGAKAETPPPIHPMKTTPELYATSVTQDRVKVYGTFVP